MYTKRYTEYLQKNNFIELKTLEYYLGGNIELAENIFYLRHKITSRGFELYIKYWLNSIGYNMTNFTGGNKADGGIDLKGEFSGERVYVQCKKYIKNYTNKGRVGVADIRNFYGGVVSEYSGNIEDKPIKLIFATTGNFTHSAIKFSKKNNIELIDYQILAKITSSYSLETFSVGFSKKGNIRNIENNDFKQLSMVDYSFNDLLNKDRYEYLKNIRDHIISGILQIDEKNTGIETFKDTTLYEIAKLRIANSGSLNKFCENTPNDLERGNLERFSDEILRGLNILNN